MQLKILLVGSLLSAVLALHVMPPQRQIVFIPAMTGPTKERPANMPASPPPVISLEEADRRHIQRHGGMSRPARG